MTATVLAESPSNEDLWLKIQEQQKMIEQQQKMIEEMRSKVQTTEQVTNKHEMQIEQAAKSVKDVEVKTAKAEKADSENWFGPSTGTPRDKFSLTGGYSYWIPDDDANVYAIQCFDCSDVSNILAFPHEEFESDLSNVVGGIKWTREFGTNDFALGFNYGLFQSEKATLITSDNGGTDVEFGTPYGTLDSSSTNVNGTNEDSAMFFMGDFEYGWRMQGAANSNIRLFAGVRAEYLNWEREAFQDLSSSNSFNGTEDSTFYGAGPRVGASFEFPISSSNNISLFGGLSGGFMYGKLERDWDLLPDTTDAADYREVSEGQFVPFGDAELGFGYIVARDIQLQLGYQAGYQSDVLHTATVCTDDFEDDVKPNNDSCGDADSGVLNHGPFLRFNWYY
jgi:hypothetical protein